jgi:hypothetical protein
MKRLEVSCAVRPIYGSLSAKGLTNTSLQFVYSTTLYYIWYIPAVVGGVEEFLSLNVTVNSAVPFTSILILSFQAAGLGLCSG